MATYIVIDDAVFNDQSTGPMKLRAGQLLDDGLVNIPTMQAQGIPVVPYSTEAQTARAQYQRAPTTRSLMALMLAAGALPPP